MSVRLQNSKSEYRNSKQALNQKFSNTKQYDLEARTLQFAKDVRRFLATVRTTFLIIDDAKQLLRSSGSIGANYREANDSLSKKDFIMRAKISRKEAKESIYWLELLVIPEEHELTRLRLLREATELMKILGAIVRKSE